MSYLTLCFTTYLCATFIFTGSATGNVTTTGVFASYGSFAECANRCKLAFGADMWECPKKSPTGSEPAATFAEERDRGSKVFWRCQRKCGDLVDDDYFGYYKDCRIACHSLHNLWTHKKCVRVTGHNSCFWCQGSLEPGALAVAAVVVLVLVLLIMVIIWLAVLEKNLFLIRKRLGKKGDVKTGFVHKLRKSVSGK